MDIYSRKVVGWCLAERESEVIARHLIETTCKKEDIKPDQLSIHADRGSPMIAGSVADLLADLGVKKSHSRPRVSNDNPYIESHFKTLKYHPDFPDRFSSIKHGRQWCAEFFEWYNCVHYHSAIGYLHPADLHTNKHPKILAKRQKTLASAYQKHPERFRRPPKPKSIPEAAWINKPTIHTLLKN